MDRRKTAAKILLWVTMTFRLLSLLELSTAIDIVVEPSASFSREEVMRDKVSHCGYFLTVTNDKYSGYSASSIHGEYYSGNTDLQNGALIGDKVDLASNSLHLKAFPLLSYAVLYWQHHAKSLARSEYVVNPLHPFYNEKSQTFKSWLGTYWVAIGKGEPPNLFTPLHLASWFGILSLAENILSKKGLFDTQKLSFIFKNWGGINKRDSYGRTALWAAASQGHESLVRLLLENGAEINLTGELERGSRVTALFCAAARGHIAVLQLLLKKGANVHDESETLGYFRGTALVWAVGKGDKDVALLLIENKANWQAKCEFDGLTLTMLMMAAIGGNVAIVQLLLRKGAKIDEEIEIRTLNGHEAVVQLLLKNEANIRANINRKVAPGTIALFVAARAQNEAAVQLLLRNGVDINTTMEVGDGLRVTALYVAATTGDEAAAQILLKNGADIEAKIKLGSMFEGPAVLAPSFTGQEAVLDFLLRAAKKLLVEKEADRVPAAFDSIGDIAEKGSGETLPELEVAILIERELRPSPIKIPLDMIELQKPVESSKFLPVRTPDANVTFVIQKAPSLLSRRRTANLCFMGETDKNDSTWRSTKIDSRGSDVLYCVRTSAELWAASSATYSCSL
ncbi:hypothetical protein V499_04344 [Pseudogymnoascus sp. VKM F-103]|nr:hypothetical protein V499_04344 [Pseudogymnoascus sp. VKM F-103]